jgi:type VI secretion system protein ImpA
LLAPIPGEHAAGESLRYEGAYDRIAEARREDDPTLTQGVWKSARKKADWTEVEKLCAQEIETRTKDLQIAAWLLEAWLHLYQFDGVREGLELLRELVGRFWDDLYPQVQDGDPEYRIGPITWINEKLSIQLKLLAITHPESEGAPAYCWSDWENACRTEVPDPKLKLAPAAARPPKLTLAEFQKSVAFTPTPFFASLAADLERAREACSDLETSLDRICGKQAPSLRQFWGVLDSAHSLVIGILTQRMGEIQPASVLPVARPESREAVPEVMPSPVFRTGSIGSRDEAYGRLAEAAEYLSRIEPHSPAPYLVKRAILWGGLSLPELLPELVRNPSELTELFKLLQHEGIKMPGK